MELFLNDKLGKISIEIGESVNAESILILAHGAGAGMHHPFMNLIASSITKRNITTVRFNFPYMEQGRKSPGSPKGNIETWKLVIDHIDKSYKGLPIFISGKSYGGRMASHLVADVDIQVVKGIIYYGFPLHAPGRDSKDRAAHLTSVKIPQLFLQGSKDKLANLELINEVVETLSNADIKVIEEADHSFNVPKRIGKTNEDIMSYLVNESVEWIKSKR
ncbi:alpha/beta hydrolase family protein [Ekhidna sp. To15]|uniref:alpha/beta hydrolase family protein n=1 Tax=Ekhidna sp. To15 TaxID=3395267 RepID=UPI003F51CEDF